MKLPLESRMPISCYKTKSLIFALTTFRNVSVAFNPSPFFNSLVPAVASRRTPLLRPIVHIRGGTISSQISLAASGDEINGENTPISGEKKASTGWNHNLPKVDSQFWTGKKELPKKYSSASDRSSQTRSSQKERVRTGWLHNTKKEQKRSVTQASETKDESKDSSGNKARKMLERAMIEQKMNHRMISPPTFHAVADGRRAVVTEHKLSMPLDRYNPPADEKSPEPMVDVYFSIVELVTKPEEEAFFQSLQGPVSGSPKREQQKRASEYKAFAGLKDAKDCILYLQGGPGFGAPVPVNGIGLSDQSSWLGAALSKGYKRIVLMDQRGTGRSSTITKQTLEKKFPDLFALDDIAPKIIDEIGTENRIEDDMKAYSESHSVEVEKVRSSLTEAVTYMTHFRADNIVKDAEAIKNALLLQLEDEDDEDEPTPRPWGAALGQSFGGFCMMTYLSLIPNPPSICLLTGGIAPMLTNVDDVYHALRERVKERNLKYYDMYPGDVDVVKRIVARLEKEPTKLPSGGILTARRFRMVGIGLGGSPSAFTSLHSLFSSAFVSDDDDDFTRAFLKEMETTQPFDDHPIYFLLHESIYADSNSKCDKTEWSAFRAYESSNEFKCNVSSTLESSDPLLLTGEVIFPWMADGDYAELSGFGMRALARSLADKDDWCDVYNPDNMKKALAVDGSGVSNAAAAVYYDDMYVDFNACMKVTQRGSPLENCKVYITNDYQHSGLRDDGANIFKKLLGMAKGEIRTPS